MIKFGIVAILASGLSAGAGTFAGVITDSMCIRDHKSMNMGADANCIKACAKQGMKYVLFDGKNTYKLSDQQTPAAFAGQKVTVTGKLFSQTGIIDVSKIEAAK